MIPFRKILLLSFLLYGCILGMNAKKREYIEPPFQKVWYRPDSVIINPSICDTINLPKSYTMIMVYESLQPETSQQLWKINRTDNKYYSERYRFTGKERDAESKYDYFGARYYSANLTHWLSVDPLADKYPWISPYAYCNWNPVKNIDPNGKWFETIWDVANVVMDVASLRNNIRNGNVGDAIVDGVGLVLDAGSVLLPFVPAGAGTAIKASRTIDKVSDASRVVKSANTEKKTFQTYIKRNPKTGEVYMGRTSGYKTPQENVKARDRNHHKNSDGYGPAEMVNTSTNGDAIRGQEQRLIDKYGGAKSTGGTSGNAINGVSPSNPNAEKYKKAAIQEFGE